VDAIHVRGKLLAVGITWIVPALFGLAAFAILWARESEGVSDRRLRHSGKSTEKPAEPQPAS
jgi:hypothetical protein